MRRIIFTTVLIFTFCFAAASQENAISCPAISVTNPGTIASPGETVTFTSKISKESEKYNVELVWTVENGKIVGGQGTNDVKILVENCQPIKAALFIKGLPKSCSNNIFEQYHCPDCCFAEESIHPSFDSFSKLSLKIQKSRIDNFLIALANEPGSDGYIVLQLDKKESKDKKFKRLYEISKHLKLRKFDKTRLVFIIFEGDEEHTKFQIAPPGIIITKRTFGMIECQRIEGEKFDQTIKELFPKK